MTASMAGYSNRSTSVFLPNHTAITLDFVLDPFPIAVIEEENTQGPERKAGSRVRKQTPPTETKTEPMEMLVQKPTKVPRKGLDSMTEEAGLGSSISLSLIYVLPLISVAAVLVCLFLTSRGRYRYHTARQRVSRV